MNTETTPINLFSQFWQNNPASFAPNNQLILSADELEKKINEMKSVENWMKINLQMLQISIQTLSAQKQMLAGFESFSELAKNNQDNINNLDQKTNSATKKILKTKAESKSKTKAGNSTNNKTKTKEPEPTAESKNQEANFAIWSDIARQYSQILKNSIDSAGQKTTKKPK